MISETETTSDTMLAVVQTSYIGIQDLQIQTVAKPHLTPLSVMIQTKFTPVLPYDRMTEEGRLQQLRPTRLPLVVGYGFGGIVTAVGALRSRQLLGQAVIGAAPAGSHQEYINSQWPPLLFPVPAGVDLAAATTLIGGADAALMAVRQTRPAAQDVVLITGASGGVGIYLVQLLKQQGETVVALARPENRDWLLTLGADVVLDYTQDLPAALATASTPTQVIDTVGSTALLNQISQAAGPLTIFSLSLPAYQPTKPGQTFRFGNGGVGLHDYRDLLAMLANGTLTSVIQTVLPFQQVREAQVLEKTHHAHGRILLSY